MALDDTSAGTPGELSSYIWGDWASDGFWIPARVLKRSTVPASSTLVIRFVDGTRVAEATGSYASTADEQGNGKRRLGDVRVLDGIAYASAPPPGDWVVAFTLHFPANYGNGYYFWRVTVLP